MASENEPNQEKKEDKKKKKTLAEILVGPFKELIEKIKELQEKLAKEEEAESEDQLNQCEKERDERKKQFFQTPYGKQTETLRKKLREDLKRKTDELKAATSQELPQKVKEVSEALAEAKRAAQHCLQPSKDLDQRYQDIAETELEGVLADARRDYDEELINRLMKDGKTREEAEQMVKELYEDAAKQGRNLNQRYDYFPEGTDTARSLLNKEGPEGDKARDKVFEEIYQLIDMWPNEFFSQAFSGMGLDMINKLSEFKKILGELKGTWGQEARNKFMIKVKAKQMYHDAVCGIEQGRANPEVFKDMMEGFTPELFDQLFANPEEEAVLAAHLYEVGMTTERAHNENWIPVDYVFQEKSGGGSQIDKWVRERFKEIIKAKHGYDDEVFEKEWSEQRIQRALAAGKGYEFVTLRMPELVARGRLKEPRNTNALVSPPYEDFVRPLDPLENLVEKFEGYDDPGAHFLLYLITGERIAGNSREQINKLLGKKAGVDPASLRLIDMVNFFNIGGPFSRSGWRGELISEGADKEWMGLSFRLAYAGKDIKKKRDIFLEELKRNPLGILREAELQDGEIFDPEVSERVRKKVGLSKDEVDEKGVKKVDERKIKIENNLILLTQLVGRNKEIDFSKIPDESERKLAEAYYNAICEVLTGKIDWERKWHNQKPGDTLIDYLAAKDIPFAPAFDDTPWGEFEFSKMGQKAFARRARDFNASNNSFKALLGLQADFGKLRKTDDLIREMDELWKAMRDYSKTGATERMTKLYEGIGRFNAGNFWKRFLPIPLDGVPDALSDYFGGLGFKPTSYAKEVYGIAANSWRGIDLRNYLAKARLAGHITKDQEKKLRGKLKCTFGWVAGEFLVRAGPLGIGLIGYTFFKELFAQLEEQVKEQG